ncbi:hypothetical protein BJV74DRAFT_985985 [Russula compacta]|nr:hypothetical protein BJV74DRAFT_985985 [Russula compacta]
MVDKDTRSCRNNLGTIRTRPDLWGLADATLREDKNVTYRTKKKGIIAYSDRFQWMQPRYFVEGRLFSYKADTNAKEKEAQRGGSAVAGKGAHARARHLSTPEQTHPGGALATETADNKAQEPRTVEVKRRTNWSPLETATELEPGTSQRPWGFGS